MKTKTIGYVRVSTKEQAKEGISIDNQIERIKRYCNYKNFDLVEIFSDAGFSGGNTKRPGLKKVIERVLENGFGVVVIFSLDRISRDMLTLLSLEKLLNLKNVELHTVEGEVNTESPSGYLNFAMKAFLSEMERRQVSYRTKKTLEHKKNIGEVVGTVPYGYRKRGNKLLPVKKEQRAIEMANNLHPEHGLTEIAKRLTEANLHNRKGKPFEPYQVARMLQNYEPGKRNGQRIEKLGSFVLSL